MVIPCALLRQHPLLRLRRPSQTCAAVVCAASM